MAGHSVTLRDGLTIGDMTHTAAELREATVGDLIDACADAERVVQTANGPELVASPSLADMALLRRQIVRIGEHPGPLSMAELRRLSLPDLALLQAAAGTLGQAGMAEVTRARGRVAGSQGADR